MVLDPKLVHYSCIAHRNQELENPTILAEFNSAADSVLQCLAHQCVQQAPPHHLVYTHTHGNKTYTFLINDPFTYFCILDPKVPKQDQIQLLNGLREALNRLMKLNVNMKLTPFCLQTQFHPIFLNLMSGCLDFDALCLGSNGSGYTVNTPIPTPTPPPPVSGYPKGRRVLSLLFLCPNKIGRGQQKKRWLGEDDRTESRDALVDSNMCDSLGDHEGSKSREAGCRNGVCLIESGGRLKARMIWRRHVWIVLSLDFAVCLIMFGIWLFVCHGFQCMNR